MRHTQYSRGSTAFIFDNAVTYHLGAGFMDVIPMHKRGGVQLAFVAVAI